jgi:hypothetical protein
MYVKRVERLQTILYRHYKSGPVGGGALDDRVLSLVYSKPGLFYHYDLVPQSPS